MNVRARSPLDSGRSRTSFSSSLRCHNLTFITFLGTIVLACGPSTVGGGVADSAGSSSDTGDEHETDAPTATSGTVPEDDDTTTGDPDSGTEDGSTTLPPNDDAGTDGRSCGVPPYVSCDPLAEDEPCGGGQACTFGYGPKGGGCACGCDLGQAGPYEPCETTFQPGDSCAPYQLCRSLDSSEDALSPQCWPLCDSSLCPADSVCLASVCFEPCDPLGPATCPDALSCRPSNDGFLCSGASEPADERANLGETCFGPGGGLRARACVRTRSGRLGMRRRAMLRLGLPAAVRKPMRGRSGLRRVRRDKRRPLRAVPRPRVEPAGRAPHLTVGIRLQPLRCPDSRNQRNVSPKVASKSRGS